MKIANYVLLGLLSCVEVLAEETTAFDKAVEAYRTYQKARNAYFEAIYAHEETRLAWDTLGSSSRANDEARKKAATVLKKIKKSKEPMQFIRQPPTATIKPFIRLKKSG